MGPREDMEIQGPGQRNTRLYGRREGAEISGRDKGAFCSAPGNRGFSAPGDVSSEQWPSHAEKCVSWTENKSCSLNGRPMPHPSPSLSEQPPLPFL